MTESERVTIPYLSVVQVAAMANCSTPCVRDAADRGDIKILNKKPKDSYRYERHLDPQSVHFWLEGRKLAEEKYAAEQKAKADRKAAKLEKKNGKQLKLKLRGSKDDMSQLDRIEEKLDRLIKTWC